MYNALITRLSYAHHEQTAVALLKLDKVTIVHPANGQIITQKGLQMILLRFRQPKMFAIVIIDDVCMPQWTREQVQHVRNTDVLGYWIFCALGVHFLLCALCTSYSIASRQGTWHVMIRCAVGWQNWLPEWIVNVIALIVTCVKPARCTCQLIRPFISPLMCWPQYNKISYLHIAIENDTRILFCLRMRICVQQQNLVMYRNTIFAV